MIIFIQDYTKKNYEDDPDLEVLRSDERWKQLMDKLK